MIRSRMNRHRRSGALFIVAHRRLGSSGLAAEPKFFPDDPLQREPETQDASKVQEWDIGLTADLLLEPVRHAGRPAARTSAGAEHQHDRRGA